MAKCPVKTWSATDERCMREGRDEESIYVCACVSPNGRWDNTALGFEFDHVCGYVQFVDEGSSGKLIFMISANTPK